MDQQQMDTWPSELVGKRVGELGAANKLLAQLVAEVFSPMMIVARCATTTAKLNTINVISVPPEIS